jgi:hypothetical protein
MVPAAGWMCYGSLEIGKTDLRVFSDISPSKVVAGTAA